MSLSRRVQVLLAGASVVVGACTGAGATPAPAATGAGGTGSPAATGAGGTGSPAATTDGASACNITVEGDTLQPLEDGFPDQPITIISIDDPGAPDGIYALEMKTAIEENSIIDQRVVVEDRPDFGTYGTWEGLEYMDNDAAGAEGYILAIATIPG